MARNFNGSAHITLSPGPIPALQSFSVAAIYRVTANPGFEAFIMGWDAGGSTAGGLGVSASGNFRAIVASSSWIPASTNISGGASDGWICVALTKVAGTTTLRLHRYLYSSDTWTRGDSSLTANNSLAPTQVRLGASASGSSGFIGDLAAAAIFNTTLTDDQVSTLPFSLGSWHSLNPSGMWVLDQSDVTQAVVDWTGRGMNESARTGSTVSTVSVPILGYGHPVIVPTRTAPPPWLNQNSGVAGRNGTNSHTIPFGFTSTSGSMLVFVVHGGVTHAESSGDWTERLQPVSSGELSVFTRTSAGDSSITLNHNGSDYPVAWTVYELPAGATWTDGTSSNDTADTFPTLTGLPGTAQLIIAARGRVAGSTGATSSATTWDAPFTENSDLFAAHDGSTDGTMLTLGHAAGYTSTSITPSATGSYGGTWVVADKQYAVFAIALGGGGGTPSTTANAGTALVGVDAHNATVPQDTTAGAGQTAVVADAYNATAQVAFTANAGQAAVGVDSFGASAQTAVTANAGLAAVVADAYNPTAVTVASATANAGVAEVTADAYSASVATAVTAGAGQADVTAAAHNPTVTAAGTATAGTAAVSADAYNPNLTLSSTASPGTAEVGSDAYNATASTSSETTASAGAALVGVDGYNPSAQVAYVATAGQAAVTADAHNPSAVTVPAVTVSAGVADVGVTASSAAQDVVQPAGLAAVSADADNPTVSTSSNVTVQAGTAEVNAGAYGPSLTVTSTATAGHAAVTADGFNATAQTVAEGIANAGTADVTVGAFNPAAQPALVTVAGHAAVGVDAHNPTVSTETSYTAQAGTADVGVTAHSGQVLTAVIAQADVAQVLAEGFNATPGTSAATVADAVTALATAEAFNALTVLAAVAQAGTAEVTVTAFNVPKQRRPGRFTVGATRSRLTAGTTAGPRYTTGGD